MSIFCTIDKSSIGTVVHKIAHRQLYKAFSSSEPRYNRSSLNWAPPQRRQFHPSYPKSIPFSACFVDALVTAGQCSQHGSTRPRIYKERSQYELRLRARLSYSSSTRRDQHNKSHGFSAPASLQTGQELTTKEELLALVDQYDSNSLTDHLPILTLPSFEQHPAEPDLVVSDTERDALWPPQRYVWPAQGDDRRAVEKLEKSLKDTGLDPEEYYQQYRALPAPRVPYLSAHARHLLLKRLGVVERKDEQAMLRYLSVVDDMKSTEIPLTTAEWNIAISFAGRYVARTGAAEVEGTLRVWREMEHVANIRANAATFNILFDAATKAGKFRLATMIYQEMDRRGYSFNRFHHVSVIHYHGLRADGDGVRKAYKDLVDAGEVVDTVVLNCMISSLIRAYEPQAALQVYERMKKLQESTMGTAVTSQKHRTRREVGKIFMKLAASAKQDPARLKAFQKRANIAPDVKTYRILMQYIAIDSGELHKTAKLLDEMRLSNVPLHGSIFLALFTAFSKHGGIRYTQWTEPRLESVWKAYLQAIDMHNRHIYIGKWIVLWALKAFKSCSGNDRAIQAWEEIKDKWSPEPEDLEFIKSVLVDD